MTERILIVGTGLIGGSIGLALARAGRYDVIGCDVVDANVRVALGAGAVNEVVGSPADTEADVVIIATPVGEIGSSLEIVGRTARDGAIVTDVGSTKAAIVDAAATALGSRCAFVGGHPMAGTEGEGIDAAREDLFDGALWILTPTEATDPAAYRRINSLVTELGAKTLALEPSEHDALVARVSHLPYALATSLMGLAGEGADPRIFQAAAGSFRDMTRTAGTNPRIWHDILSSNREAIGAELDQLIGRLQAFRSALGASDLDVVDGLIAEARAARRRLPMKGERTPAEPVTVDVHIPDRAGVLAEVTTAIGEGGINIEDLWMDHRAAGGVLRVILDGRSNAETAVQLLAGRGFRAVVLEER